MDIADISCDFQCYRLDAKIPNKTRSLKIIFLSSFYQKQFLKKIKLLYNTKKKLLDY